MPHVKGIRRDGFINVDDNVDFRGTVRGAGDGIIRPYGALDFYVDGTDGRDTRSGKSWNGAFKTIQKAITAQIAQTNAKGDNIWVAPGTYAESLTGNLTRVQIVGAGRTGIRPLVKIHPTTSYAYTGEMTDSGFENLEFATPDTSSTTFPAICITGTTYVMVRSYINGCFFYGAVNNDSVETTGICIGTFAAGNTTYEYMDSSEITNNVFGSVGGKKKELSYAIEIAAPTTSASGQAYKGTANCLFAGNRIFVKTSGIIFNTPIQGNSGTVVTRNIIGGQQSTHGLGAYGVHFNATAGADQLCMVVGNWINSNLAAVYNGSTAGNVLDNMVSAQGIEARQEAIAT